MSEQQPEIKPNPEVIENDMPKESLTPEMQALKDKLDAIRKKYSITVNYESACKLMEIITDFVAKLREEYSDHKQYLAYHVLADSGTMQLDEAKAGGNAEDPKIDFPGEYSVEKFIDGLEEQLLREEKK